MDGATPDPGRDPGPSGRTRARDEPLAGLWYLAAAAREIRPGRLIRRILFGEPIALGRTPDGRAFAMLDVCPHRAAPLSGGRIETGARGPCVACPYHGWRFRIEDGAVDAVPALSAHDAADPAGIAVKTFTVAETNGLLWIWRAPAGGGAPAAPPDLGLSAAATPKTVTRVTGRGPYDEAAIGLIDPAHTPFVHKQWWWRQGAAAAEKEKRFEPTALGFRMPPHAPSSNSRIYKIFGGAPTTAIEFRLPALRIETIRTGNYTVAGVTAMTPGEADETRITHAIFWDAPFLNLATPIVSLMGRNFLGQDGAILNAQNLNLARGDHRPLYLGDPDKPAQWYMKLKQSWTRHIGETGTPDGFENPITPATLRWRT
ncbi:MAG: Rieske 2Fe-2S domain-containing protein [Pseudomonadota bacterium]